MKRIPIYFLLAILLISVLSPSVPLLALSPEQKRILDSNIRYLNIDGELSEGDSCGSTTLSGSENTAKIYNYLISKGFKPFQAAGIMGNLQAESGYNPRRVQGTRTPSGDSDTPPPGDIGYGLAQWTPGTQILSYATETGRIPSDLGFQLDYLWKELQNEEKAAYTHLLATTNVAEATVSFETKFERHTGSPQPSRIVEAERILALVAIGSITGGSVSPSESSGTKPIIALDPGHGGTTIDRNDPQTGLHDGDYNNEAERLNVFAVAQIVKTQLEQTGYQVLLTKNNAADSVFLRDRASVANTAGAALAVSIHTQGDKGFGAWQEIYAQKVGLYRGTGAEKQTFTDAAIAEKSQKYAAIMKQERDAIEVKSGTTVIKDNSFDGRGNIEPGNIPLVELWSQVPWIYLEAGGNNTTTGLTDQQKATYANAIVSGVKKAIPLSGSGTDSNCTGSNAGLSATVLGYAWPEYHPAPYVNKKPEYEQAVRAAITKRMYVGGIQYPGVDCGGFITLLMVNSGFESRYNYGGALSAGAGNVAGGQKPWLDANWQAIGQVNSTNQLQPGDVAVYKDLAHTFIYVGNIPGFGSVTASSSLDKRAPMADRDDVTSNDIIWYRKK